MSLNNKKRLIEIAKFWCRENRKNATKAEKKFWEAVRRKSVNGEKIRRQYPVFYDITGNESFYIADFFFSCKAYNRNRRRNT